MKAESDNVLKTGTVGLSGLLSTDTFWERTLKLNSNHLTLQI